MLRPIEHGSPHHDVGVVRRALLVLVSAAAIAVSACSESPGDDTNGDGATDVRPSSDASPRDGSSEVHPPLDGLPPADQSSDDSSLRDSVTTGDSSARDGTMTDDASLRDADQLDGPEGKFDVDGAADTDASACPGDVIWNANSARFTLSSAEPAQPPQPPAPECKSANRVYEFDATERTLSQVGCMNFRSVARVAHLDSAAVSQIVGALQAMRTPCSSTCRNDVSPRTLAVRDAGGCVQQSYDIDVCNLSRIPPYLAVDDVAALSTLLDGILAAVCGASTDGVCGAGDGGANVCKISQLPADAGADASRDSAVDTEIDARGDALDGDAPLDGDGAICVREPVWRNFSSLVLRADQGPSSPPPPDGGCTGTTVTYEVSLQAKTLLAYGCMLARMTAQRVELVDSQMNAIVAAVAPMRTTCETNCAGDASQGFLSLADCSGNGLGSYASNYSPLCNLPPPPPLIDSWDLSALRGVLSKIVFDSCQTAADAGSAGVCSPRCRQIVR